MKKITLSNIHKKAPVNTDKIASKQELDKLQEELSALQSLFYAAHSYSLLIIFQGIDTFGKDSGLRNVFSKVNPLGIQATSFKAPCDMELQHDYMWRIFQKLPEKGMIQIFNRSYYEDVLVPAIQKTIPNDIVEQRYDFINAFENLLQNIKTILLNFFLHISKNEQKKRIMQRLKDPLKKWKYTTEDMKSSKKWNEYTIAYEQILNRCSPQIPWIIVPADNKWYRNYIVASTIVSELKELKFKYPNKIKKR